MSSNPTEEISKGNGLGVLEVALIVLIFSSMIGLAVYWASWSSSGSSGSTKVYAPAPRHIPRITIDDV